MSHLEVKRSRSGLIKEIKGDLLSDGQNNAPKKDWNLSWSCYTATIVHNLKPTCEIL